MYRETRGVCVTVGVDTASVTLRLPSKNVLIVEYMFNGEKRTKQVPEGEKMILP